MKKYSKLFALAAALFLGGTAVQAQVKYQLQLLPDNQTYVVSMVSSQTWEYPQNLTSTAQVTVKVPSLLPFTASVTSLLPEVTWLDNAYLQSPASDPAHTYISFGLVSLGTSKIPYTANEETPLFSFRNVENVSCVGKVSLIDNVADALSGADAEQYNIGNQLSVLAAQGNVYTGNLAAEADCTTAIQESEAWADAHVRLSPVPTADVLTVDWTAASGGTPTVLRLENMEGKVIATRTVSTVAGKNSERFAVSHHAPGAYSVSLVQDQKVSKKYKFLIIR